MSATMKVIRRETFRCVQPATSQDSSRYALHCIQIATDGSCVATDGHVLIKATEASPIAGEDFPIVRGVPEDVTAPTGPILIPAEAAEKLCKATPKKSPIDALKAIGVCTNGDGSSYAAATDLECPMVVKITPDGLMFPAIDKVIPGPRETIAVVLGVAVLEALLKSAKAIEAKSIRFEVPTEPQHRYKEIGVVTSAVVATYRGGDVEAFALAMPMLL